MTTRISTFTIPEKLELAKADSPIIEKLADGKGFLMLAGNCGVWSRTVTFYYSADGKDFYPIGEAFYQPDNRNVPMNSATGGGQAIVPGPGKHQYYIVFYAHDPKLPGRHKTRIEGNMIQLVFPDATGSPDGGAAVERTK